jgi:RNA polymerase sigma-70 factor (ECF subfamily)
MNASEGSALAGVQVRAFREGDAAAADWLARRACRLALRTSGAILRSREQAGDVAQDVAVDVLRSLVRLRDPEAFDAWVHRITVRHALRALGRRQGRERAETTLEALGGAASADARDLDLVLAARDALSSGLSKLPAKQRLALALRYVHDRSDEEIAAALGCRPGSVHALLSRGRAALRNDQSLVQFSRAVPGG